MWFNRQSVRLRSYNYATAGVYFITVCTHDRAPRLASINASQIHLTTEGEVVNQIWFELPKHFPTIELDEFIVMPNHIHGILILNKLAVTFPRMQPSPATTEFASQSTKNLHPTLGVVIGTFKSLSSTRINREQKTRSRVWQRNFYEHIIRSAKSLDDIRRYIHYNPQRWSFDRENPDRCVPAATVSKP